MLILTKYFVPTGLQFNLLFFYNQYSIPNRIFKPRMRRNIGNYKIM
jgi:hypothetical protein